MTLVAENIQAALEMDPDGLKPQFRVMHNCFLQSSLLAYDIHRHVDDIQNSSGDTWRSKTYARDLTIILFEYESTIVDITGKDYACALDHLNASDLQQEFRALRKQLTTQLRPRIRSLRDIRHSIAAHKTQCPYEAVQSYTEIDITDLLSLAIDLMHWAIDFDTFNRKVIART